MENTSTNIKKIKRVLLHKPGNEILAINGDNKQNYFFNNVPDLMKLQAEFDNFVSILETEGVEVFFVQDYFNGDNSSLTDPNLMYLGDMAFIHNNTAIMSKFKHNNRLYQQNLVKEILLKLGKDVVTGDNDFLFESGDAVQLNDTFSLVAVGNRTNIDGFHTVRNICKQLGVQSTYMNLPEKSYISHLDTIFAPIDKDVALFYKNLFPKKMVEELDQIDVWIDIEPTEQKTMGANVLPLENGKIISFSMNSKTNAKIRDQGFEVIEIDGDQLYRGNGGPKALTLIID